jgi:hypothetical protein
LSTTSDSTVGTREGRLGSPLSADHTVRKYFIQKERLRFEGLEVDVQPLRGLTSALSGRSRGALSLDWPSSHHNDVLAFRAA